MARSSAIYSVEGAVWGCLTVSWLAVRLSLSRSPLEEAALISAAVLGVSSLVCSSFSTSQEDTNRLYFNMLFAIWLAFVYETAECLTISSLGDKFLSASALGSVFPTASAAISLSLLTVQVLIAAAATSESVWRDCGWADATVVLVTSFQVCAQRTFFEDAALSWVFNSIIFLANAGILAVLGLRSLAQFPLSMGIQLLSAEQIMYITSISLIVLSSAFTLAAAYMSGTTLWALPVVLGIAISSSVWHLLFHTEYREAASAPSEAAVMANPTAEDKAQQPPQIVRPPPVNPWVLQPPPPVAPRALQPLPLVQPKVQQPPPPVEPKVQQQPPPVRPQVQQTPAPVQPQVQQTPPPFFFHQHHARSHFRSRGAGEGDARHGWEFDANAAKLTVTRIAQDALLFGHTRPLVAKSKKTS